MSGAWTSFKRAFGGTQRRDQKAQDAVAEIAVQANVRTQLGDTVSAAALNTVHGLVQGGLAHAQGQGDTNAGYKDLGTVKDAARKAIPEAVEEKRVEGLNKTIPSFIESAQHAIDNVAGGQNEKGYDKRVESQKGFQSRLNTLKDAYDATDSTTTKAELDKIQAALEKLTKDALKIGYSYDNNVRKDYEDLAYKKALEARYGIKVESSDNKSGQRLAKVLDILPDEHIAHTSLSKIKLGTSRAVGDYTGTTISIDMAGVKKRPKFEYVVDGKKTKVDTFTVATLHEVGHAVDDKAGLMANPATIRAGNYGGWETKDEDQVADAFWTELERTLGAAHKNDILPEIKKALDNKTYQKPAAVSDQDWATASKTLAMLKALAADQKPWEKTCAIGDRVYHKNGDWVTYSLASRKAQLVRAYQWRAPGEWFAELYAISWLTKTKPPAGIAAAPAEFMYRGKR